MRTGFSANDIKQQLGADRVLDPGGGLPQTAERLDPSGPVRPFEFEVEVERFFRARIPSSHREIRQRADGDPARMAGGIEGIVQSRGKMHNPATGSGGGAAGKVTAVGGRHGLCSSYRAAHCHASRSTDAYSAGVDAVNEVDPGRPGRGVGNRIRLRAAAWGRVPDDLPDDAALAIYDVCAAEIPIPAVLVPRGRHRVRAGRRACRQTGACRRPRRRRGHNRGR